MFRKVSFLKLSQSANVGPGAGTPTVRPHTPPPPGTGGQDTAARCRVPPHKRLAEEGHTQNQGWLCDSGTVTEVSTWTMA